MSALALTHFYNGISFLASERRKKIVQGMSPGFAVGNQRAPARRPKGATLGRRACISFAPPRLVNVSTERLRAYALGYSLSAFQDLPFQIHFQDTA